jgi:diaminohydroxyphosphoribosylaminopyrimidine deaminase / 5-amino-6-(5-phosphoribosylamino)uracil reductase
MAAAVDRVWMQRALELAALGLWTTRPNPRVGCVLVAEGQVVGEGWHQRTGGPHAEVHALRMAGDRARGATAYVTLEPCAHFGRTPPCADALIAAGVSRVVIATGDPFAAVAGRGIQKLRAAGIVVEQGIGEDEARELNLGFLSRIERGRPWVRAKVAQSLDGRSALSDGRSQWITGPAAREDGHRWRARACAILTGSGTLLADDPRLDSRPEGGAEIAPQWRVLVDSRLRTPLSARLWQLPGPVLWVHGQPGAEELPTVDARTRLLALPDGHGRVDLGRLLEWLAREQLINELHVEAGPWLTSEMLSQQLVDELLVYQAPLLLGPSARPALLAPEPADLGMAERWTLLDSEVIGPDVRLRLCRGAERATA